MQTIEALYENGSVIFLKTPVVKRAKVLVTFLDDVDKNWLKKPDEASDADIELSTLADIEEDYLTDEEVEYYMKLETL